MRPLEVSHRRIAATLNDSNHRLIIITELQNVLVWEKSPPQRETGKAAMPQGKIRRNHLGFRRGVRNTSLTLANPSNRKA
eukprot:2248433-Heterocapsa_arctica.AAC.1